MYTAILLLCLIVISCINARSYLWKLSKGCCVKKDEIHKRHNRTVS